MNKQKHEALTRLVRTYKNNPNALKHLQTILTKHLDSTALLAVEVAQESGDPIGKVLAESLAQSDNTELLFDIYEKLPSNSVALMEVSLTIAKRMVELAKAKSDDTTDFVLAEVTASYAEALADMGQRQQALALAQESVCFYQRSTDKKNALMRQAEVDSQAIFARCLMSVGQLDDAILVQENIIAFHQKTTLADNEDVIVSANSLLIMSSYLRMQEDYQQAFEYAQKALDAVKPLADTESRYRYIKHRMTRNLANCYESVDNLLQASELLKDTLQTVDDLAGESKDRYELELIDTLECLAGIESRRGDLITAQDYASQAIKRMDSHYQARQQAFASSYSTMLTNLALVELASGALFSSQQKMDQAVTLLEPLCKQHPERFSLNLAAVLNNRVEVLLALNEYELAIADSEQCLELYSAQAGQQNNCAMALNTLSNALMQSGDIEAAQQRIKEGIEIYQQLMTENNDYQTDLAMTLGTLAVINDQVGDYSEALKVADRALDYWHTGEESALLANPQTYHKVLKVRLSCLMEMERYDEAMVGSERVFQHLKGNAHLPRQEQADTFSLQSNLLYLREEYPQAEKTALQGIEILRSLAIDEIPSYKVDLADALGNLCFLQAERDQALALETIKEAAKLYQELPDEMLTVPMVSNIVIILQNLGAMAQACEDYDLALDAFQKAIVYQQQIVDIEEDYRYDLSTLLQLLLNLQVIVEEDGFYATLEQLRQLLHQLPFDDDIEALLQNLSRVEASFRQSHPEKSRKVL